MLNQPAIKLAVHDVRCPFDVVESEVRANSVPMGIYKMLLHDQHPFLTGGSE